MIALIKILQEENALIRTQHNEIYLLRNFWFASAHVSKSVPFICHLLNTKN
jgi:hypothetical protein